MAQRMPLVVVLGATACGKSRLAIELARRFGGEIISADSMQVYKGLDIATNKVSEEEKLAAKHHMIDILDPTQRFSVVDFRDKSLNIIDQLIEREALPILVGGTHYYIESILWKGFIVGSRDTTFDRLPKTNSLTDQVFNQDQSDTLIEAEAKVMMQNKDSLHTEDDFESIEKFFNKPIYNDGFTDIPSEKLWEMLELVDSKQAHLYHPKDKRRIIRCLQIFQDNRKTFSDLFRDINKSDIEGKQRLGGPLRFEKTCVFWLSIENELLDQVLDSRVDEMIVRGLLEELEDFHDTYNRQRVSASEELDYEKGVFQNIGLKEFHEYLILPPEVKNSSEGQRVLNSCNLKMKLSTRRYARRQVKWIKRRFLQSGTRDLPPMFKLDVSSDENHWQTHVHDTAIRIVESIINGSDLSDDLAKLKQEPTNQGALNDPGKFYCEPCDRTFIGSHYINEHLNSKKHQRIMKAFYNKNSQTGG